MKRRDENIEELLGRVLHTTSQQEMDAAASRVLQRLRQSDLTNNIGTGTHKPSGAWQAGRILAAAAAVVLAVLVSLVLWPGGSAAVVEAADNGLFRVVDGKAQPLQIGEKIDVGQTIRSDGAASTFLALDNGSRIEMRPKSELAFEDTRGGLRIRLDDGSIIVSTAKQRNWPLYVQTRDAKVSVADTVSLVTAEPAGSRVAVIHGEVEVQHADIQKKLLPGEQVATAASMQWASVAEEIAWSRNKATHVALLQSDPKTSENPVIGPSFEVASVKRSNLSVRQVEGGTCHGTDSQYSGAFPIAPPPLGRCVYRRVSLKALIQQAYDLRGPNADDMVSGGPGWSGSEKFDIEAKAETPTSEASMRLMIKALLEDRFKLKLHRETKDLPGYALLVAGNGPKLTPATGNEEKPGLSRANRAQPWTARAVSMSQLAKILSSSLSRPVSDETGLTGLYNFSLQWTPGENEGGLDAIIARLPAEVQARIPGRPDPNGPSIFTAVQEQLGLRLQSRKVPSDIYVIDAAQPPTEN